MKKILITNQLKALVAAVVSCMLAVLAFGQNAVISTPLGIGRNCGTSKDSFRVLNYNDASNTLTPVYPYVCKPNLGGGSPSGPAFSSSAGSIAYNPYDQNVYYIATSNGNNSFVYHWRPDTCHTSSPKQAYSNYYSNQFVVGLDFNPTVPNEGFQFEMTGASGPFGTFLRKVDFSTNTFGSSDTLVLSGGKKIYQQNGDIIFTPSGQLYIAFDNKLFKVDFSTYGSPAKKVYATFIDTLIFNAGYYLTGISYAQGKFIGSTQSGSGCAFKEIDISSGSAVISSVTLPANNFTATDMATMISGVGVAKRVYSVSSLGSNNWMVQYDVSIKNFGNINLTNVQLKDSIAKVFGSSFTSASATAVGTLPSGITLNPSYNGNTDCNLFTGGSGSTLASSPSDSAKIRITVMLSNPDINTTFYSTAIGSGQSLLFSNLVTDSSNNSATLQADLNDNGVPDDNNEDIATPLRLNDWVIVSSSLLDFNARLQTDRSVEVYWKLTNNESLKMEVQRSSDAVHFSTINVLASTGASGIHDYHFIDNSPVPGLNYYRIRFVRSSGEVFYSDVVKINLSEAVKPLLQVSPVPFSDKIFFTLQLDKNERISCKLIDFTGRIIYAGERTGIRGANRFAIDQLQPYPSGSYVLQVKAGEQLYNKIILKTMQ